MQTIPRWADRRLHCCLTALSPAQPRSCPLWSPGFRHRRTLSLNKSLSACFSSFCPRGWLTPGGQISAGFSHGNLLAEGCASTPCFPHPAALPGDFSILFFLLLVLTVLTSDAPLLTLYLSAPPFLSTGQSSTQLLCPFSCEPVSSPTKHT